jgi:hypothetical protein
MHGPLVLLYKATSLSEQGHTQTWVQLAGRTFKNNRYKGGAEKNLCGNLLPFIPYLTD